MLYIVVNLLYEVLRFCWTVTVHKTYVTRVSWKIKDRSRKEKECVRSLSNKQAIRAQQFGIQKPMLVSEP